MPCSDTHVGGSVPSAQNVKHQEPHQQLRLHTDPGRSISPLGAT
jgi:hypothetical protein